MTTRSGRSTAITRAARLFRSSRTKCSSSDSCVVPLVFDTPMLATEVANRFRRIAAPPDARKRGHPRIVPAVHMSVLHQRQQLALAQQRVGEIQPVELELLRRKDAELLDEPVVQRPVIFELEGADRVGHLLDRIRLPVRVVVHRIDAPLVARPVMVHVQDAIHHRIAHVQVRRGHVDLGAQRARAVRELALLHALEQVEILFDT